MGDFFVGAVMAILVVFMLRMAYVVFLEDFFSRIDKTWSMIWIHQRRIEHIEDALQVLKERVDSGEDTEYGSPPG